MVGSRLRLRSALLLCLAGALAAGAQRAAAARDGRRSQPRQGPEGGCSSASASFRCCSCSGGGGVTGYAGRALGRPVGPCGLLRAGLAADPDGLALISADTRWTWRTLDDLSDRLAAGLLGLGLSPGDRVASLMPNRPALIVHYLACFKAGL